MISRFPTLDAARQKRVIAGFHVATCAATDRVAPRRGRGIGGGRPPDTPAVLWHAWVAMPSARSDGQPGNNSRIRCANRVTNSASSSARRSASRSRRLVRASASFRHSASARSSACCSTSSPWRWSPLARATPFQHHGGQRRVLTCAARQRSITRRQKQIEPAISSLRSSTPLHRGLDASSPPTITSCCLDRSANTLTADGRLCKNTSTRQHH